MVEAYFLTVGGGFKSPLFTAVPSCLRWLGTSLVHRRQEHRLFRRLRRRTGSERVRLADLIVGGTNDRRLRCALPTTIRRRQWYPRMPDFRVIRTDPR